MSASPVAAPLASHRRARRGRDRASVSDRLVIASFYVGLTIAALLILYPLVYILSASLSDPQAVTDGRVWLWPVHPTLASFKSLLVYRAIPRGLMNTIIYVTGSTILGTICTLLAGWPLSRPDLPGRNVILTLFVIPMFFGGGMIPTYLWLNQLGLINTRWVLILPGMVSSYLVIIARTFFSTNIPQALHDSAQIDGASEWRFFTRIVVPMSRPLIAVVALMIAVGAWGNYFGALIYLTDERLFPLQLIMRQILTLNHVDPSQINDPEQLARQQALMNQLKFALIVITILPPLLIYPFAARHFKSGMAVGSLKG